MSEEKMEEEKISDEDAYKSPTKLSFGKSPKKSFKKKRRIISSPDQSQSLKNSLEKTIVDLENEEDVYHLHSLSLRLNIMEAENKLLKEKILNLENENLSLKTNIDEIKINIVENKYDTFKDSFDAINIMISDVKKKIKSTDTTYAALKKQMVDLKTSVDDLQNDTSNSNPDVGDPLSYANIVKNGGSIQKITDKVLSEAKIRSLKEMNVIITGLDPDNLDVGTILQSKVYSLIALINKDVDIINSVKLFSKKENKFTNKVVVTLSLKEARDNIIKLSKNILKGKSIFINPDLTPMEMEVEYKLRQEKKYYFLN